VAAHPSPKWELVCCHIAIHGRLGTETDLVAAKKEKNRLQREGKTRGDPKLKGENFYRSAKKIKTLNMFKDGGAIRNKEGKIVKAASYQSREVPKAVIEPNRRWFTNTRVIAQDTLKSFREAIAEKEKDPYCMCLPMGCFTLLMLTARLAVLLKSNKLPMSLIRDGPQDALKKHEAKMTIESEPFSHTFGPKAQRKRPKISFNSMDDLAVNTEKSLESYHTRLEEIKLLNGVAGPATGPAPELADGYVEEEDFSVSTAKEPIFNKGQSKRIWNELCKFAVASRTIPTNCSQTRSSTRRTLFSMFWMLVTHWVPGGAYSNPRRLRKLANSDVAAMLRSISQLRLHTNILFLY
jgi:nuclear GTP-binding protein